MKMDGWENADLAVLMLTRGPPRGVCIIFPSLFIFVRINAIRSRRSVTNAVAESFDFRFFLCPPKIENRLLLKKKRTKPQNL
jgi:hypothetical protein